MFERFTDRSRQALVLAQEEARLLGHAHLGTEHILLGLIGATEGGAAQVLVSCGLELDVAREVIGRLERSGRRTRDTTPFTPGAKRLLERSLREALARGSDSIGTEHLLLGLVSAPGADDIAVSVLAERGITPEDVRRRVENVLAGGAPEVQGVVQRFFEHLSGRDWPSLGTVLAADVVRVGPLGDQIVGRERYLDLLAGSVPERYGNEVHRVLYAPTGTFAVARVTEHLYYPAGPLHLEEAYAFEIGQADAITRVEVFWQSPGPDEPDQRPSSG